MSIVVYLDYQGPEDSLRIGVIDPETDPAEADYVVLRNTPFELPIGGANGNASISWRALPEGAPVHQEQGLTDGRRIAVYRGKAPSMERR